MADLAGLEHGILAIGGTACAIAVLAWGSDQPPMDFSIPWAVIPVPGFPIAFWARNGGKTGSGAGKAGAPLGRFLESIHLIRAMFVNPRRWGLSLAGIALFWAAEDKAQPPDEPGLRRSA